MTRSDSSRDQTERGSSYRYGDDSAEGWNPRTDVNVSDVGVIQETLKEADFDNYTLKDVPGENWIVQILPTLLMAGILIFFMHEYECAGRRRR